MSVMARDIDTLATTAAGQYQHFIQFCIQWSSIALLYYDYSLTLADERKLIWSQTLGVTTVLYVLCRYALAANLIYLLAIAHLIDDCDAAYTGISSLSVLGRAAVLSTWATRTWVVWDRKPTIILFLGSLVVGCTALDCYHASGVRCTGPATHLEGDKALSIMVVVFEFISTALMAYRCFPAVREQRRMRAAGAFQRPLLVAVFQQGLFYYCAVSLFTVTALILNYAAPKGFFQRLLNAFTLPISGLLTARFILHLRTIAGQDVIKSHVEPDESVVMSRMDFNDQSATQASYVSQSRTFGDVEEGGEAAAEGAAAMGRSEDRPSPAAIPAFEDKKGKGKSVSSIPTIV